MNGPPKNKAVRSGAASKVRLGGATKSTPAPVAKQDVTALAAEINAAHHAEQDALRTRAAQER